MLTDNGFRCFRELTNDRQMNITQQHLTMSRFQTLVQFLFDYRTSSFLWKFTYLLRFNIVEFASFVVRMGPFFPLIYLFISLFICFHFASWKHVTSFARYQIDELLLDSIFTTIFSLNLSICIAIWLFHRSYFMVCLLLFRSSSLRVSLFYPLEQERW